MLLFRQQYSPRLRRKTRAPERVVSFYDIFDLLGAMMTKKEDYAESFKRFNIDVSQAPIYKGPEEFAGRIKKCTLLTYGEISYSDTSAGVLQAKEPKGC
jgi:hypothetical protein